MITSYMFRLTMFFAFIVVLIILYFGFLFFEPFLTEKTEVITVINKEKWVGEEGKYFIFTENEVFLNANDYYQNKENADELYKQLKRGVTYKVKVVGVSLPFIPRFRNIVSVVESSISRNWYPK